MAAQSLLAKLGMRMATLGTSAAIAVAFPLSEGDPSTTAHTSASRIGWYADRTPGAEKVGHVVQGTEVLSVKVNAITAAVQIQAPASTTSAAPINLGQGTAPTSPVDGDVWITSAGMFVRAGGSTAGPFSAGGGGTIGGSIAVNQVAFGSGANTIQGSSKITFTTANGLVVNMASSGADNLTIGNTAGDSLTSGINNTLLGTNAGTTMTTANNNVAIGYNALASSTDNDNVAIGAGAADALNGTSRCVAIGRDALGAGVGGVTDSTAVGWNALFLATGAHNTAIGSQAGDSITSGADNVVLGFGAGTAISTSSNNTALGTQALLICSTAAQNTAVGAQAGNTITGAQNTVVGYSAGGNLSAGTNNVSIGYNANIGSGVISGVGLGDSSSVLSNAGIAIGREATVPTSTTNTMVCGSGNYPVNTVYFGKGVSSTTATAYTIAGTTGSGTDNVGAALNIAGGQGTGTGVGGAINFQTAKASTTGATLNALVTRLSVLQDGAIDWTGIATASAPALSAANHGTIYYNTNSQAFFASVNGGAYAGFGTGTIGGSATSGQVAYGSGSNTITSSSTFTFSTASGLSVNRPNTANTECFGATAGNTTMTGVANTLVGSASGTSLAAGTRNSTLGYNTLNLSTAGTDNVAVGWKALAAATSNFNTAIGSEAVELLTTGTRVTGVGYLAMANAQTGGSDCTAVGYLALTLNSAVECTAIGSNALKTNISATGLTAVGFNALALQNSGNDCTAMGHSALAAATGANNTAFGSHAADVLTTAARVTAVGKDALGTGTTGVSDCTAIGYNALAACTAAENTAVGAGAADAVTSATHIVAIGKDALGAATSATSNDSTAVGWNALLVMNGGSSNTALGSNAASALVGGTRNTTVGTSSLTGNVNANDNTAIGYSAGFATITGNSNVFIGSNAGDATASSASNRFVSGGSTTGITNVFFGNGEVHATPVSFTLNASGGSGTDIGGASVTIAGGISTGAGAGGSVIIKTSPATGSSSTPNTLTTALTIDQKANLVMGTAALSTGATDGFLYVASCAGTPSGTPTAFTGRVPIQIDTTAGKFWAYYGGAWHFALLT